MEPALKVAQTRKVPLDLAATKKLEELALMGAHKEK